MILTKLRHLMQQAKVPDGMSHDEMLALIAILQADNARLKDRKSLTLKVSGKGAVSLYGMGHYPVTLYANQWQKLLAASPDILAFICANESRLSLKKED